MPKIGDWIEVRSKLVRERVTAYGKYHNRTWRVQPVPPCRGLYIGYRTISDGRVVPEGENEAPVYFGFKYFRAALVVIDERKAPILVPWEEMHAC